MVSSEAQLINSPENVILQNKHIDKKVQIINEVVLNIISKILPPELSLSDHRDSTQLNSQIK